MKPISKFTIFITVILITCLTAEHIIAQPRPGGKKGRGGSKRNSSRLEELSAFDKEPLPQNKKEKDILAVLDDMDKNQRKGMQNISKADGRFLRIITEAVNAQTIVEIGTSNGYSGTWFSLALLKTGGKLITHDIDPDRIKKARANFKKAGVDHLITIVEGDAHDTVKNLKDPIDILFLDADKEGYIDYLKKLLPLVKPGGLIMAHNAVSSGKNMTDFIEAITKDPLLDTDVIHRDTAGISITLKKR